jgi:hypothetical protein
MTDGGRQSGLEEFNGESDIGNDVFYEFLTYFCSDV